MEKYKVAIVQIDTGENREDNLSRIEKFIKEASEKDVALVTLPEVMNRMSFDNNVDTSEPLDGPTMKFMKACAVKYKIWIHCGSIREKNPEGLPYNTTLLLNPNGEVVCTYRKLHLYDVEIPNKVIALESSRNSPGKEIVSVNTELGHFGMTICYDLRFPELFRILALQGSEVIFVPANFAYSTGEAHWEALLRARAIENTCYIIASGQVGQKSKFRAYGNSMIISPWGEIITKIVDEEGIAIAEIDLNFVRKIQQELPSLKNRRDDIYELKVRS